MKRFLVILILATSAVQIKAQLIDIATARTYSEGSSVTVRGIVLNGSELGPIRYIQDNTGAIAVYDFSATASVLRGDSIEVTGNLDNYNELLEISPVSSLTIINSGNPLPAPSIVSITSGWDESYEGKLITVDAVTFTETGTFSTSGSGTNYEISDGSSTATIRVATSTNIDGTIIPEEEVNITGIMSQYAPGGSGGYQLLPRDLTDISTGGNPPIISTILSQSNISTTSFTVSYETLYEGNTIIFYGSTASSLSNEVSSADLVTTHSINLTGLTAGSIYYLQGASVSASNDTSFSPIVAMATASNSSGDIRIWFNNPVDNSVSTGTNAVYNSNFVDTVIHFIDNAFYSIDMALYNIDNVNNIVTALNDAYQRGVIVRVICDAEVNADAYSTLNIGASNKKLAPTGTTPDGGYYGIQHNKFIVVDAVSTDPLDTWVITGSTNFTDDQLKIDKQNMIAIQDQSLAKAYRAEFEEMFSGKFGPEKSNNTPHEFIIGGKRVELYFSPSDDTENRILSAIESAQQDLYFAVFSYTRYGISYEIEDAIERGVFAAGIWDQTDALDPTAIEVLEGAMSSTLFESAGSALMHHKYLIVDAHCPQSDPLVLTGSHNWTSSANSRNDENTLIIHDSTIANIYYQEFSARYNEEGGTIIVDGYCDYVQVDAIQSVSSIQIYPNPASETLVIETEESIEEVHIQLIDLSGRILVAQNSSGNIHLMDVSGIKEGMYLIYFSSEQEKGVSRLLIAR